MVDQAYENALKRKRELERELQEVDTFIKLWQRFARTEAERPAGGESPEVTEPEFGLTPSPQRGLSRDEVGRWAREIILQHGMPMTRGELVNAFEAKGLPIGGVDPSRNMGTIMWRLREKFVNISGRGYWPADVENEEAGYTLEEVADIE